MTFPWLRSPWLLTPLAGAGLGTIVLGAGSRLAMRGIALALHQPVGFSVGGTLTVVFLGAVSGAGGGLLFVLSRRLLYRYPVARTTLFWTACLLLTLQGLSPVNPLRLALFVPLVVAYGVVLHVVWNRWIERSRPPEDTGDLTPRAIP